MMMQRKKGGYFIAQARSLLLVVHERNGGWGIGYIAKRRTIASSGNHCHQLVLFRAFYQVLYDRRILLRCCCRSRSRRHRRFYGTTALSLMQQPFDLRKLIKIINNEKWQWRKKNNAPTSTIAPAAASAPKTTNNWIIFILYHTERIVLTGSSMQCVCKHYTRSFLLPFFLCGTICFDLVHHVIYGC